MLRGVISFRFVSAIVELTFGSLEVVRKQMQFEVFKMDTTHAMYAYIQSDGIIKCSSQSDTRCESKQVPVWLFYLQDRKTRGSVWRCIHSVTVLSGGVPSSAAEQQG